SSTTDTGQLSCRLTSALSSQISPFLKNETMTEHLRFCYQAHWTEWFTPTTPAPNRHESSHNALPAGRLVRNVDSPINASAIVSRMHLRPPGVIVSVVTSCTYSMPDAQKRIVTMVPGTGGNAGFYALESVCTKNQS